MVTNKVIILDSKKDKADFSLAIITKSEHDVLVMLQGSECIIYNGNGKLQNYVKCDDEPSAYLKWLQWIGGLCKKDATDEYFLGTHNLNKIIDMETRIRITSYAFKINQFVTEKVKSGELTFKC